MRVLLPTRGHLGRLGGAVGHHLYVRTRVCVYVKGELDPYCTRVQVTVPWSLTAPDRVERAVVVLRHLVTNLVLLLHHVAPSEY